MRLLPLIPSAHPSAWTADAAGGGRQQCLPPDPGPCRFCGQPPAGWQAPFHRNGDHADDTPENVVAACPLCHLAQHLNRPTIEQEAVLVWLPELTQAALNGLVRGIHLVLHAHGEPAPLERRPRAETDAVFAAYAAHKALLDRSAAAARARLGTTSPRQLGAALLALSPAAYADRAERLGGVRLLPRGRLFRGGEDVYPEMLAAWAAVPSNGTGAPSSASAQPGRPA